MAEIAPEMPPRKKLMTWKPEHASLLQSGFTLHNWDPEATEGRAINNIIKSSLEIFDKLKPFFFSVAEGGEKSNNNQIYAHYKAQASEYITSLAHGGMRHWR
jgi:hypothetical protein